MPLGTRLVINILFGKWRMQMCGLCFPYVTSFCSLGCKKKQSCMQTCGERVMEHNSAGVIAARLAHRYNKRGMGGLIQNLSFNC